MARDEHGAAGERPRLLTLPSTSDMVALLDSTPVRSIASLPTSNECLLERSSSRLSWARTKQPWSPRRSTCSEFESFESQVTQRMVT